MSPDHLNWGQSKGVRIREKGSKKCSHRETRGETGVERLDEEEDQHLGRMHSQLMLQ